MSELIEKLTELLALDYAQHHYGNLDDVLGRTPGDLFETRGYVERITHVIPSRFLEVGDDDLWKTVSRQAQRLAAEEIGRMEGRDPEYPVFVEPVAPASESLI